MNKKITRDDHVDIMRFIGLSLIIFAHINPPAILFQLRNFDVPLMVMVSGMSYVLSSGKLVSYKEYFISRCQRLVFPVWTFLTILFCIIKLFNLDQKNSILNTTTIISSYGLISGIGFVWVIRIFLLVALMAPIFYPIVNKTHRYKFLMISFLLLLLNEMLVFYITQNLWGYKILYIFNWVFFNLIPYGVIFFLGVKLKEFTRKDLFYILSFSFLSFVSISIFLHHLHGKILGTQVYKYPPTLYYIMFSLIMITLLYINISYISSLISKLRCMKKLISMISENSLWIYLWHIPLILFIHVLFFDSMNFIVKYLAVYFFAFLCAFFQFKIVNFLAYRIKNTKIRKILILTFTG